MSNATPPSTVPARRFRAMAFASIAAVAIAAGGWIAGQRAANSEASPGQLHAGAPEGNASAGLDATGMADASNTGTRGPTKVLDPSTPSAALLGAPSMSLAQLAAKQVQARRELEGRFVNDPADPAAASLELSMLKSMADPALIGDGIAPGDPQVKCHRNSCRISADFNSSDDASSWAVNYVTLRGGTLSTSQPTMTANADGSVHLQLYAVRKD